MLKLQAHEIESYLRSKGKIRRRGRKAEIELCPFCNGGEHKDRWKCVVYLDETGGNFKCMRGSCNQSGSFWQLAEHFGDDPKEYYDREKPKADIEPALRPTHFTFKSEPVETKALTDEALKYLQRRGFSEDVLDDCAIWCDENGKINFGYYHKGELCMVKVREPRKPKEKEQKAWQAWKGGLRTLWGVEQLDPNVPYIVITFGEYDRIALKQAKVPNAVSVPCGDQDLEWINVCWDELEKFKEVFLWIDNDKSGQEALPKIAERLGKERVRVVRSAFKDANEMLLLRAREVGEEVDDEIFNAVATAEWYYNGDLVQLSDVEESEQCFDGYLSGIRSLDKALGGFFFTQLILHVGDNKHGKSVGVNQITAMAVEGGGRVCVWPGEDNINDYKYKLGVHLAGYDGVEMFYSERTGTHYAKVLPDVKPLIDEYLRDKLIVLNSRVMVTEEVLLSNFKLAFQRFGCNTFVVDNLMKIVAGKDAENINARQTRVVNCLSDFAKDYRVTVHLVAHTNKSGDVNEPPTKRSVSGAKEIVNLADRVVSWWRIPDSAKGNYQERESLVSVIADRVFGDEISIPISYDKSVKRYGENIEELQRQYSIGFKPKVKVVEEF